MDEEINYWHAGDLRDIDYDGTTWEAAYICTRCWALIPNGYKDLHTEWHRNL